MYIMNHDFDDMIPKYLLFSHVYYQSFDIWAVRMQKGAFGSRATRNGCGVSLERTDNGEFFIILRNPIRPLFGQGYKSLILLLHAFESRAGKETPENKKRVDEMEFHIQRRGGS